MPRICALLVLLGWVHSAVALDPHKALTQYSIAAWTQQQGLPQDTVSAITQTSDGYLWLGTDEGLARFDGYEFTIFGRDHGDLPSNSVTALAAGKDGSLWIGTRSGITRYRDQRFRTYTRKEGLADDLVVALFVDHAGILWIVAGGNLSRFDGSTFTNFIRERDLPLSTVRAVTEDSHHNIYVSGNNSVVKLNGGKFVDVFEPAALRADFPQAMQVDNAGNLWIIGIRGLIERLPNGAIRRYGTKEGLPGSFGLNAIREDRGGTIWVGTDLGLTRLEGTQFRTRSGNDEHAAVRYIFEDREGNLWVGSNNGLTRFRDDAFTSYGKSEGLPSDEPSALYQDRSGRIWAGFDSGVVLLTGGGLLGVESSKEAVPGMPRVFARRFRETHTGEVLLSSREGLIRIRNGRMTTFVAPDPQNRKTVFDTIEDSSGTLWLALPNGLGELRGDKFQTVIPAGPLFLEDSFNVLAEGNDGSIWAGTLSNGLWQYKDGLKRHYRTADGLGSDQIRSLYFDAEGTLWIGTVDGGLNTLHDGKVFKYTARDGLPSDNIRKLTDDGESLWLSTTRGISRVSKKQLRDFAEHRIKALQPVNYGVADGLRSAQAIDGQRHADGTLWFITSRGIAVFDPRAQESSDLPPLIHLLDMSMDGRRFKGADNPRLPPGSGRLQIRYTAIHLRAPDRVQYSYMLSGLDSDWVRADALRAVNYDSLRHGHYRFRIKAEIPGGPYSESSFEFDLLPHYYETAWFRSLCVLALAGMAWMVYRLRDRQIRSRFAIVLEERARLAREVHDTLAQGFVGIASQLDVVELSMPPASDEDARAARSALELAQRMAHHSLTEARRSLMDLRANELQDQDLAAALKSGATLWVANSGIDVEVDVNGESGGIPEEVAHHVFRIAQEAVTNSVNHADANQITLKLKIDSHQLSLRILDDGCGFEPDDVFTSKNGNFGLIGMRERAERLGGHLRLESRPGNGTRLDVTVPLG